MSDSHSVNTTFVEKLQKQKPGAGPGFIVESHEYRATAYPAVLVVVGRRAREVMPAAM